MATFARLGFTGRLKANACLLCMSWLTVPSIDTTACAADTAGSSRPNVIVIFTDDQGYQNIGCFGSEKIRTPHLDQTASEGMDCGQDVSRRRQSRRFNKQSLIVDQCPKDWERISFDDFSCEGVRVQPIEEGN